jgi:hypothetical protein
MAQKVNRRVDSESVQGKGTYVVIRKLTLGEAQQVREQAKDGTIDDFAMSMDLLTTHLVEWNWSDANEVPFPLPSADPAVMSKLTDDEVLFLVSAIRGQRQEADFRKP